MLPRIAYISDAAEDSERRGASRRTVHLPARDVPPARGPRAILLDLSETGLRLQCRSLPQLGEVIFVDLPLEGQVSARVVWLSGDQCGAEFERRVSKGAVSAAVLSSPPNERATAAADETDEPQVELVPIRAEWALMMLMPLVLLLLFALAFLPVSGF